MKLFTLIFAMLGFAAAPSVVAEELPNVIVIMADDMGYGDPGHANSASKIPTPTLDKLAEEGVRLTDAHTPSSGVVQRATVC